MHVLQPPLGFRTVLLRFYGVKIQLKPVSETAACASVRVASSGNEKPVPGYAAAQESELCWRSCTGWAQGANGSGIQRAPRLSQYGNNAALRMVQVDQQCFGDPMTMGRVKALELNCACPEPWNGSLVFSVGNCSGDTDGAVASVHLCAKRGKKKRKQPKLIFIRKLDANRKMADCKTKTLPFAVYLPSFHPPPPLKIALRI